MCTIIDLVVYIKQPMRQSAPKFAAELSEFLRILNRESGHNVHEVSTAVRQLMPRVLVQVQRIRPLRACGSLFRLERCGLQRGQVRGPLPSQEAVTGEYKRAA